jgi:L-asparagine oxygenase
MAVSFSKVGHLVDGSLAAVVARDGYVLLNDWHLQDRSEQLLHRSGQALAFGKNGPVHRLSPKQEAKPNTYSGIYGLEAFPLHSDMAHWRDPPRIIMLRCIKGRESVATVLLDGSKIVECAGKENLARALVKPRRPLNGAIPLLTLLRPGRAGRASLLRWDEKYIVPASPAGEYGMNLIRSAITRIAKRSIYLRNPGDTLFFDNWRMLHGRSAVGAGQVDRIIERAYLERLY